MRFEPKSVFHTQTKKNIRKEAIQTLRFICQFQSILTASHLCDCDHSFKLLCFEFLKTKKKQTKYTWCILIKKGGANQEHWFKKKSQLVYAYVIMMCKKNPIENCSFTKFIKLHLRHFYHAKALSAIMRILLHSMLSTFLFISFHHNFFFFCIYTLLSRKQSKKEKNSIIFEFNEFNLYLWFREIAFFKLRWPKKKHFTYFTKI